MAQSPGLDVAQRLAGVLTLPSPPGGQVTLALGGNLYVGPERPVASGVPARAVFCLQSGGPPRQPYLGADSDWVVSVVQVVVRGSPDEWDESEALARACLSRLQRAQIAGYVSVLVRESEPVPIGYTEQGLHRWALNVELGWRG